MLSLLIIDDDTEFRESLRQPLQNDYKLRFAASRDEALAALATPPDAVLLDLRLSGTEERDGLDVLRTLRRQMPHVPVVIVTGQADVEIAVECMSEGASSFLQKRPGMLGEIKLRLNEALKHVLILNRNEQLERKLRRFDPGLLVGSSQAMQKLRKRIQKLANYPNKKVILVRGERGTGKELIVESFHRLGLRRNKPFVPVDVRQTPEDLLPSVLFGSEKGSFTGADERSIGMLEQANNGILFLDEIGNMNPAAQDMLLRFLQEFKIVRIGSKQAAHPISLDVQVIAATNANLEQMQQDGQFREDLYDRLERDVIQVPPLRDRMEDIPELIEHFLQMLREQGSNLKLAPNLLGWLMRYDWPGNVRQLENSLGAASTEAEERDNIICCEDFPARVRTSLAGVSASTISSSSDPSETNLAEETGSVLQLNPLTTGFSIDREKSHLELLYIRQALEEADGVSAAATSLGYNNRHQPSRRCEIIFKKFPDLKPDFPDLCEQFNI